jgi:hypothetical protein
MFVTVAFVVSVYVSSTVNILSVNLLYRLVYLNRL